jgi:hypothetical protein
MTKKENFIALLIILSARTVFLFADAIFYTNKNIDLDESKNQSSIGIASNLDSDTNTEILDHSAAKPNFLNTKAQDKISHDLEEKQLNKTIKENLDN